MQSHHLPSPGGDLWLLIKPFFSMGENAFPNHGCLTSASVMWFGNRKSHLFYTLCFSLQHMHIHSCTHTIYSSRQGSSKGWSSPLKLQGLRPEYLEDQTIWPPALHCVSLLSKVWLGVSIVLSHSRTLCLRRDCWFYPDGIWTSGETCSALVGQWPAWFLNTIVQEVNNLAWQAGTMRKDSSWWLLRGIEWLIWRWGQLAIYGL